MLAFDPTMLADIEVNVAHHAPERANLRLHDDDLRVDPVNLDQSVA